MGCMSGLNSLNLQYNTAAIPATSEKRAAKHIGSMTVEDTIDILINGGRLALTEASDIEPDFNPLLPLLSHPFVFPNADGECPVHMSESKWSSIILARGGRHDRPDWVLSECDRQFRHLTYLAAYVQLRMTPRLVQDIGAVPAQTVKEVAQLLKMNYGPPKTKQLQNCSAPVKAMFEGVRIAGKKLKGTPQSYASLKSKAGTGATALWGEWTSFVTINMSEAHSEITFAIMGQFTEFDLSATGGQALPSMTRLKQALVNHPAAVAEFSDLVIRAFHAIILGWPVGEPLQVDPDCLAGIIGAIADKFEYSGRQGGKHDHLLLKQPPIAARQLKIVRSLKPYHSHSVFYSF